MRTVEKNKSRYIPAFTLHPTSLGVTDFPAAEVEPIGRHQPEQSQWIQNNSVLHRNHHESSTAQSEQNYRYRQYAANQGAK